MEFEDLQKIWDTQNDRPMYAINEQALHNRIVAKKHEAMYTAAITEWILIVANVASGIFVLVQNYRKPGYLFVYLLAIWMLLSAAYMVIKRMQRIKAQRRFNRTMAGDLQQGIAIAAYQLRIAYLMRWNMLIIAALCILSIVEGGKSLWMIGVTIAFFALVFYASKWEMGYYRKKKRELEQLQGKLLEEEGV